MKKTVGILWYYFSRVWYYSSKTYKTFSITFYYTKTVGFWFVTVARRLSDAARQHDSCVIQAVVFSCLNMPTKKLYFFYR